MARGGERAWSLDPGRGRYVAPRRPRPGRSHRPGQAWGTASPARLPAAVHDAAVSHPTHARARSSRGRSSSASGRPPTWPPAATRPPPSRIGRERGRSRGVRRVRSCSLTGARRHPRVLPGCGGRGDASTTHAGNLVCSCPRRPCPSTHRGPSVPQRARSGYRRRLPETVGTSSPPAPKWAASLAP